MSRAQAATRVDRPLHKAEVFPVHKARIPVRSPVRSNEGRTRSLAALLAALTRRSSSRLVHRGVRMHIYVHGCLAFLQCFTSFHSSVSTSTALSKHKKRTSHSVNFSIDLTPSNHHVIQQRQLLRGVLDSVVELVVHGRLYFVLQLVLVVTPQHEFK